MQINLEGIKRAFDLLVAVDHTTRTITVRSSYPTKLMSEVYNALSHCPVFYSVQYDSGQPGIIGYAFSGYDLAEVAERVAAALEDPESLVTVERQGFEEE